VTLRLTVDPNHLETPEAIDALEQAAAILRRGGLVALPTETVYGLGANALDAEAVARIFTAKQRPSWDPVIVHVDSLAMVAPLVTEISEPARRLMEAFWPGPLTLLLPRSEQVPDVVTAGRALMGVRMPAHPVAWELIRRAGVPVAAPSANLFSHISPTTAEHVLADLDGRIDVILDAGAASHGVESTVLDPTQTPPVIYRPGAISREAILRVVGEVEFYQAPSDKPGAAASDAPPESLPSPGVGIRHYAPRARLILVEGALPELPRLLGAAARPYVGQRLGVMLPEEVALPVELATAEVFSWGRWQQPETLAHGLYAGLRQLDERGCQTILCPLPPAAGIGAAIEDRLRKAAQ
jgi:L-threonylcarbamoyladenylate synthase